MADLIIPTIKFKCNDTHINDEVSFIQNKNTIRKYLDELEILKVSKKKILIICN